MKIQIHYFAVLREQAGRSSESWESSARDPEELWTEIARHHGFQVDRSGLSVAVDEAIVAWDHPLAEGSEVAFLPPVSGG